MPKVTQLIKNRVNFSRVCQVPQQWDMHILPRVYFIQGAMEHSQGCRKPCLTFFIVYYKGTLLSPGYLAEALWNLI